MISAAFCIGALLGFITGALLVFACISPRPAGDVTGEVVRSASKRQVKQWTKERR